LWSLGVVLGRSNDKSLRSAAGQLFEIALPAVVTFTSPRAWAFALMGIEEYLDRFPGDRDACKMSSALANRLIDLYGANQSPDWRGNLLSAGDRSQRGEPLSPSRGSFSFRSVGEGYARNAATGNEERIVPVNPHSPVLPGLFEGSEQFGTEVNGLHLSW
jgi:hypothetical protein